LGTKKIVYNTATNRLGDNLGLAVLNSNVRRTLLHEPVHAALPFMKYPQAESFVDYIAERLQASKYRTNPVWRRDRYYTYSFAQLEKKLVQKYGREATDAKIQALVRNPNITRLNLDDLYGAGFSDATYKYYEEIWIQTDTLFTQEAYHNVGDPKYNYSLYMTTSKMLDINKKLLDNAIKNWKIR